MRLRLVLALTAAMAPAAPAAAEKWQPVAGEADTYVDADFTRLDQQSGLVVLRTAQGTPSGAGYAEWGADKTPIAVLALDCKADAFKDLGLDFEGDEALPDGWRAIRSQPGIKFGVGAAGTAACKQRDTLPKVALP